jgi:hypothetical protein
MRTRELVLAIFVSVCAASGAQVVPATTAPIPLTLSGTLSYSLGYTQTADFYGGSQGAGQIAILSGEAAYGNSSPARPFTLMYSGGDMWNIAGASGESGVFQNMMVSQGFVGLKQGLTLSDSVSYMPEAPTTGFSGIPGVGTLPGLPTQPTLSILTLNTPSVLNATSATYTHTIDRATSIGGNGSYQILRFPDGGGLEMDSWQAGPQITWRLNALNSISAQYAYSRITYPGSRFNMDTQSAMFGLQRTWNRRFQTNVSAGPQWIQSSDSAIVPFSTYLTLNASATYAINSTSASLSYFRSATGGAGVETQFGVEENDIIANLTRQLNRNLSLNATFSYMLTGQLQLNTVSQPTGATNAEIGGVGATQRLSKYITVNASYTGIQQSSGSTLPANAINGFSQMISFGIAYAPRPMHFKK